MFGPQFALGRQSQLQQSAKGTAAPASGAAEAELGGGGDAASSNGASGERELARGDEMLGRGQAAGPAPMAPSAAQQPAGGAAGALPVAGEYAAARQAEVSAMLASMLPEEVRFFALTAWQLPRMQRGHAELMWAYIFVYRHLP